MRQPVLLFADLTAYTPGDSFGGGGIRVGFRSDAGELQSVVPGRNRRYSPVLPVRDDFPWGADSDSFSLLFLTAISDLRILRTVWPIGEDEPLCHPLLSLGSAGTILVGVLDADWSAFLANNEVKQDLVGWELWRIKEGTLTECRWKVVRDEPISPLTTDIDFASPIAETRSVVEEYLRSVEAVSRTKGIPSYGKPDVPSRLFAGANELLEELGFLEGLIGARPSGLSAYSDEELRPDSERFCLIKQQRVARLVQINSHLSYVLSQACRGSTPILGSATLVQRHELLGIGGAVRSITRLVRSLEAAFAEFPMELWVGFRMNAAPPFNGYLSTSNYVSDDWAHAPTREELQDLRDGYTKRGGRLGPRKLVHFSGRLGFRETEFGVTAGLSAVSSGAGRVWNIVTLTHEILHGHVRDLLSQALAPDPGESITDARARFLVEFDGALSLDTDASRLVSVRNTILAYACLTPALGSLTSSAPLVEKGQKKLTASARRPADEKVWELLESEFRNMNEVLVHVLDFTYFYNRQTDLYVDAIWRSWSAVPAVLKAPRPYVLRTLLAISSRIEGKSEVRFREALEQLKKALDAAAGRSPNPVFGEVKKILDRDRTLIAAFLASIRLVDLASKVFYSNLIQGRLFGSDRQVKKQEGLVHYALEPGSWDGEPVRSAPAFVLDRLRRAVLGDEHGEDEASAFWLYFGLDGRRPEDPTD